MAKIDVYLRSIERFGAAGAILISGQSVTLRFPTGDRHATQVTPHDQLVALVREVAPPPALDQVDKNRPAKFDVDSNGTRYTLTIQPKPGSWQVGIELASEPAPAPVAASAPRAARIATAPATTDGDLAIERGQYDGPPPVRTTSGSPLLDQLTAAARAAHASDLYLATGVPPAMRVGGELKPIADRAALDAETLSRELGIVAPADARAAWTETGVALFTYGDGLGRVRATLTRDHRGPSAALRLLVAEPPTIDRVGIKREVLAWLDQRGLMLVSGASGTGKTTTVAALVRELGARNRFVVAFEEPIEIVQVTSPWVSQRAIGEHVPGVAEGVASAMLEGADAIVLGAVSSAAAAVAIADAVAAGHLVLATIATPTAQGALEQLIELLPADRRQLGRGVLERGWLGTIGTVIAAGRRSFDVVAGRGGG